MKLKFKPASDQRIQVSQESVGTWRVRSSDQLLGSFLRSNRWFHRVEERPCGLSGSE